MNKKTWLTLALGMSVTYFRVVMPFQFEVTPGLVVVETLAELVVCVAVVWLNFDEVKAAFTRKINSKEVDKIAIAFAIVFMGSALILLGISWVYMQVTGISFPDTVLSQARAAVVGDRFMETFAIGPIITMVILAPIWEEVVFRLAFRKVIKHPVVYVVISSLCFAFLHTASLLTLGITDYFIFGVLFCLIFLKTKDLRVVIIAHMLHNAVVVFMGLLT